MKKRQNLLIAGLGLLALVGAAHAQKLPQLDASTQARVDGNVRIGREIYAHDQAAWHATDAMLAANKREALTPVKGWVTERVDRDTIRVVFVQSVAGKDREFYSATVDGSKVSGTTSHVGNNEAPVLAPSLQKAHDAQTKVRSMLGNQLCGRLPNVVVLDSESVSGGLDVFAIVPEMKQGEAVLAGHKRVTFGPNGGEGVVHDYSNSCAINPDGRGVEALVLSVPPDRGDIPHEMHIFGQLNLKTQFFVLTMVNGRTWGISQGVPLLLAEDKSLAVPN